MKNTIFWIVIIGVVLFSGFAIGSIAVSTRLRDRAWKRMMKDEHERVLKIVEDASKIGKLHIPSKTIADGKAYFPTNPR